MAKPAKQVEVEITNKAAIKLKSEILDCFERIESERGKFMNYAKRQREKMTTIYEGAAQQGIPQRVAKANIKIIRALERIKTWMADLEAEESKLVKKLAKAQGDKQQLGLFGDLPTQDAPKRAKKEAKQSVSDLEHQEAAGMA